MSQQQKQCTCNVTLRRVHKITVAIKKYESYIFLHVCIHVCVHGQWCVLERV
jgi:hypothetical protein